MFAFRADQMVHQRLAWDDARRNRAHGNDFVGFRDDRPPAIAITAEVA
jgi:hypothetical protein